MHKSFLNSTQFRAAFPLLYGIFVYSTILLVFDSLSHLQENFFSLEAILCVLITYCIFEGMKLVTFSVERWGSFQSLFSKGVFLFIAGGLVTFTLCSVIVWSYFSFILEFTNFQQELFIFNTLFISSALFYMMIYLSFSYLNEQNTSKIEKEGAFKAKLEWQFERFRGSINPMFLYQSLETLISMVHSNPENAQDYIGKLASYYRYVLEHQSQELISLYDELTALENQVELLNEQLEGTLKLSINVDQDLCEVCKVIPGSLQRMVGSLVASNIINQKQPLHIECTNDGEEYLVIQNALNEKLTPTLPLRETIEAEQKAYLYFTSLPVVQLKAYNESMLKIPLLYPEESQKLLEWQ